MTTHVLFVCLGNICRSPTAHGIFAAKVDRLGLGDSIAVDSAGTSGWHIGSPPDGRAIDHASRRGYDLSVLSARQVQPSDFQVFDYILAMDKQNLKDLQALAPESFSGHLGLFLEFSQDFSDSEVPDPYYGGNEGFEFVLDLIESASDGLLAEIRRDLEASC